ncbi:Uncharacterised protein [Proteus mirabilis]|uniref:Uncharacterized protein n=1 Tax=Proteus mirabilis TaxID=584 RepID=A0A379FIN3_PROMI|nr:Uncharacterised protein [Proteus mirabilis]
MKRILIAYISISLNKVQNIWIEEYINKFYGGEEIIMDKSTDDNVAYFVGILSGMMMILMELIVLIMSS